MPNETLNISKFNKGIICSPDIEDIPDEAASDSLNLDANNEDGKLKGIPTNGVAKTIISGDGADIKLGAFIENDGLFDLIYHDQNENKIKAITDFYGTEVASDLVTANVSDSSTIVINNKEAHIGTGSGSANVPKWVGYIDFGQFEFGTSWNISDASNASPIVITAAGHFLKNGNFVKISSVGGNTAANGIWQVANSDIELGTFELAGTMGNGVYTTGGTAEQNLCVENAECGLVSGIEIQTVTETTGSAPKYFVTTKTYYWALSYIYDGYQESPIVEAIAGYPNPFGGSTFISDTPSADSEYYTLHLRAGNININPVFFNKRITGINIYRAERDNSGDGTVGVSKLIAFISINHEDWADSTDDKVLDVVDYGSSVVVGSDEAINIQGISYQENAGIAETLESTIANYALSAEGDGFHFVGKCYHASIPDAEKYIFKSKEKRYDMFDWSKDFLILPRVPTAMIYYEGRLYAFDQNHVYRINPDGMFIEEGYEGAGAIGQRSVCATPYGMFFGNEVNSNMLYKSEIIPIGNRIKESSADGRSWQSFTYIMSDIIILYEAKRGQVFFINSIAENETLCWAYHIQKDRWDCLNFEITVDANSGAVTGKDGEVWFSNATQIVELCGGASRQDWEFASKDFNFDDPSQDKKFYKFLTTSTGTGTLTTTFGIDNASPTTPLTNSIEVKTAGEWTKANTFRFKLTGTGTIEVDSASLIYRRMAGKRE